VRSGEAVAAALTAAGILVALGDVALVVTCWRSKSVLGGILGLIGIPLVLFARLGAPTHASSEQALLIATGALVLGAALLALGRALERLLDSAPEDES
jgi:hypothetical protein